jgi:thymidylate synthase
MPGGNGRQKILVFEQNGKSATKTKGILEYGGGMFDVEVISVDADLPPVIEDSGEFLPSEFEADLVLDYLVHPDLSHDLGLICRKRNIPDAASGKKVPVKGVFTPPTCCGLVRDGSLGRYGELFGSPELKVEIFEGSIREIEVVRGAPCGATWKACENIVGLPVEEALTRIGLETQFHCTADPSNWDPIHGKSPVHFAGHVHKAALKKALQILESKDGRTGNIKI